MGSSVASADEKNAPFIQIVQVLVDSAFTRVVPLADAKPAASVFEGDLLEAIGRNADGTWFEVRRRGHTNNLGWISIKMVSNNFNIEFLPLADAITGVTGSDKIADTNFGAYVNIES